MKQIYLIIAFPALLLWTSFLNVPNNDKLAIKTLVIDAGHGGKDPGCLGATSYEKHVALAIALKLGAYIEEHFPEIEVIYTRKTDVFVTLYGRADIANKNDADLFISVHCNANTSPLPYGASTYIMGTHKNEANLEMVKRENEVILMEDDYSEHYDGFDPSSPETHIMFNLFQNAYQGQSIQLASMIQEQFGTRAKRKDRGVHEEGFIVLYKTTMPSVLIETGFLTNREEEIYLNTKQGQDLIASAIFRAFRDFNSGMQVAMERDNTTEDDAQAKQPENKIIKAVETGPKAGSNDDPIKNEADLETPQKELPEKEIPSTEVIFKVQIISSKQELDTTIPKYRDLKGLDYYTSENGLFKYTVGAYNKMERAVVRQQEIRKKGFPDAFLVVFKNGKRVPIQEALQVPGK